MKTLMLIFFLLFLYPSLSFSGVKYDVSCPSDKNVAISFQWKSTVNITVASNTVSAVLPETPSGIFSSFTIPAYSSSLGVVPLVFSSGTIQNFSCAEVPVNTDDAFQLQMSELYLKMYMFAFGVILALAFISGMKGST